jgi:hypothetical protein
MDQKLSPANRCLNRPRASLELEIYETLHMPQRNVHVRISANLFDSAYARHNKNTGILLGMALRARKNRAFWVIMRT